MDIMVLRNAFGRQVDSFETDRAIPALDAVGAPSERGKPFLTRAPLIEAVDEGVEVLTGPSSPRGRGSPWRPPSIRS